MTLLTIRPLLNPRIRPPHASNTTEVNYIKPLSVDVIRYICVFTQRLRRIMGITTISLLFGVSLTRFLTQQAELVNERKIISALPLSQAQPISIHTLPLRDMLHQGSGNFMLIGLRCGHGNPLKDSQMVNVPIRIMETHSSHTNLQLFLATAGYVWK